MDKIYDCIVIGGGPAGLAAGIYAGRAKMSTIVLEKDSLGGQIVKTDEVANYPGSVGEETGPSLIARMVEQAKHFGAEIIKDGVVDVELEGEVKVIKCEKETYKAKTVILATGAKPRLLGCPGETELTGKGVSYCATCDGDFFTDLEVFVIGAGDSACEEAMFLTKFARKVTIVSRKEELTAAKSIVAKLPNFPQIEVLWNSGVEEIRGDGVVESIVFRNLVTNELTEYKAHEDDGTFGVFVFIGFIPSTKLLAGKVDMDKGGYIVTDDLMHTNIPGVFAAGDMRQKFLRQVVTATSDGAIAAMQAEKYIQEHE